MSYVRFGVASDVYVYEGSDGLVCCGCTLDDRSYVAQTAAELDDHLREHIAAGSRVPDGVIGNMDDPTLGDDE